MCLIEEHTICVARVADTHAAGEYLNGKNLHSLSLYLNGQAASTSSRPLDTTHSAAVFIPTDRRKNKNMARFLYSRITLVSSLVITVNWHEPARPIHMYAYPYVN